MKSEIINHQVDIFVYPPSEFRISETIYNLMSLIQILSSEYSIKTPFKISNCNEVYPDLGMYLKEFLDSCKQVKGFIDINWLTFIRFVIKDPDTINNIRVTFPDEFDSFLGSLLNKAINKRMVLHPIPKALFIQTDLPLETNQGPWGACFEKYPDAIAVETTGKKESLFHEFLHIFGVGEGYDDETKKTLYGCESCWMQYVATKGNGFCKRHQKELIDLLNRPGT